MSETLEQSAKRAWLEVYELRKERDLHKNSALDYLSLWNASVIERDELKTELQKELQRRWDGNEDSSREYRELAKENEALTKERDHWKANHDNRVEAARFLIERTDMQVERITAYKQHLALAAQNVALISAVQDSLRFLPVRHPVTEDLLSALNLPNLAESVLKRRDAETLDRIVSSCREHHCGLKVAAAIRARSNEGEAK